MVGNRSRQRGKCARESRRLPWSASCVGGPTVCGTAKLILESGKQAPISDP
jgi:hypothetical protein